MSEQAKLVISVEQRGANEASAALAGLTKSGTAAESSMAGLALKIAGYTSAANLAIGAGRKLVQTTVELGKESIVLAAGYEKARVTWGVLVGDMERGTHVFEQIRQAAAKTPLSFEGLNQAATTIKGFGVATEELIPTLMMLGDIAMGDNEKLQRLSLVYGQVAAQGKAKTQDLYQFINAGVPIFNMLADSMNAPLGSIKELASEGRITFEEIDKAIKKATTAGGQFYEMMDKTAQTTAGKWSTAVDNWKQKLAALGEKWLPLINGLLDEYNNSSDRAAGNANAFTYITTGSGDADAAIAYLENIKRENEAAIAMHTASREAARGNTYAWQMYTDKIKLAQQYLAQVNEQLRIANERRNRQGAAAYDAAAAEGGTYKGPMTWRYWEQYADKGLAEDFIRIQNEATQARLLGREYEVEKAKNDVIDKWIDFLLTLTPAQTSEQFTADSRSVQELVAQKSVAEVGATTDDTTESVLGLGRAAKNTFSIFGDGFESVKQALNELKEDLAGLAMSSGIDLFEAVGAAMVAGASGADTFRAAIDDLSIQILNALPTMLLSAGLKLVIGGQIGWGLALIGLAGITAIGAGAANYAQANPQEVSSRSASSASASPSYSAQAIATTARTASRSASLSASSGAGVSVVVNNYASNTEIKNEERTSADGSKQVVLTVKNIMKGAFTSGEMDQIMMARYKTAPAGRRIG